MAKSSSPPIKSLRRDIWSIALRNAIFHSGKADVGAVMSSFLGSHAELRPRAKELKEFARSVVDEVNQLPVRAQKLEALKLSVNLEHERKPERAELPNLAGAERGKIVTRAAPNPDGPMHLGNARAFLLSWLYAKKYDGRFILRYDDTDPRTKPPIKEAYRWILEDLKWLGVKKPDIVVYQSDRFDVYYSRAFDLITSGKAYVCTCEVGKWRKLRDRGKPCPCRSLSPEEQIKRWHGFMDTYEEGKAVVRIKTDLGHPNPAIRDWPALRIITKYPDHPRVGNEYRVWPMYNFASPIDDHDFGVTHVLRAQEHSTNTEKQKWLFKWLNWEKIPAVVSHGRLALEGTVLSKSKIRAGIEAGEFRDWDDPRLGTIRALRRRGFRPQAIVDLIRHIGPNKADISVSAANLGAFNRKLIDPVANRYNFVGEPRVKVSVKKAPLMKEVSVALHPDFPDRGKRSIPVDTGAIYIEKWDLDHNMGKEVRLKELFNVIIHTNNKVAEFTGKGMKKDLPKLHWVSEPHVSVSVVMGDGSELHGIGEPACKNLKPGTLVQFVRFGFCRVDSVSGETVRCWFAHK